MGTTAVWHMEMCHHLDWGVHAPTTAVLSCVADPKEQSVRVETCGPELRASAFDQFVRWRFDVL
jgi:hypothetical protein